VLALAFAGQTKELVRLLSRRFPQLPSERHRFWLATAELLEGKIESGQARLKKLRAETRDAILRRSIDRRLASAPKKAHLSASGEMLLGRLIGEKSSALPVSRRGARGTPAVWARILLNLAMFGVELLLGGATNIRTLHFLGALEPGAVIVRHEYWRLLSALFLHYGALHLAFNLYALYLLGPELERILGSFKFTLSYLISGLGSSAGVVLLSTLRLTEADLLVGASGCVMGVIGVSAGLLLRHRQSPLAGRRLRNLIVIVALQTVFDLSTPQVSLSAHLSGFLTGVGVGTIFASARRRARS
jgi:rhomboid protease GluP